MNKDSLGDRMKDYEDISRAYLTKRMPVIIRIDGKAFHTFTRGFQRPFDPILMDAMQQTAGYLCANVMGCKLAYAQSDEISLLLTDYDTIATQPWFGKNLQKMVSVAASMATMAFNVTFRILAEGALREDGQYAEMYMTKVGSALFDARAFVLPHDEVCNYFIWRQQDASKNSIQMLARAHFSHRQLHGLNEDQLHEKLFQECGVNWNNIQTACKRGCCIIKEAYDVNGTTRSRWIADTETPIFTQDRHYIEQHVFIDA